MARPLRHDHVIGPPRRAGMLSIALVLTSLWSAPVRAVEAPNAADLMPKVLAAARNAGRSDQPVEFTRSKTTTHYDSDRKVISREERVYQTSWLEGRRRTRLIQLNGKPPPTKASTSRTPPPRNRNDPITRDRSAGGDSILSQLKEDVIRRFEFSVVGEETIGGRPSHVITLAPRTGWKPSTIEEQVMAQMAGRIWVDAADYQVARVDVKLRSPVKVGLGGVLGALREFELKLDRTRVSENLWMNASTDLWVHFRQLFTAKRLRHEEAVSDVRTVTVPP